MSMLLGKAHVQVLADASRFRSTLATQQPGMMSAVATLGTKIRNILGTFGIAAGGYMFLQMIRSSEEFNSKMRESLAIMGDVSGEMRGEMRKAALDVGAATKFGASQAAEAYYFLASAGLDAEQSIAALPQVAQFAQAGVFDLATATDLATDAQSALGLTVKDSQENLENMTRVTDVLVKANTLANASVEQFSRSLMHKAGAAAKIVGKDVEETVAVLAAFADQGTKGQRAGNALNIVFRDLQTRAINNKKEMEALGVNVFDATGDMRNMADIILDLENALSGMSDEQKKAALLSAGFQDRSVSFIQTLIGTSDKIRKYEIELRKAAGTTRDVASKQISPLQKGVALLGSAFIQVSSRITEFAGELLGPLLGAVGLGIKLFGDINDALGGMPTKLATATLAVTLLGLAIKSLGPLAMRAAAQISASILSTGWGVLVVALGVSLMLLVEFIKLLAGNERVQEAWNRNARYFAAAWDSVLEGIKEVVKALPGLEEGLEAIGADMDDIAGSTANWLDDLGQVSLSFARMKGVWKEAIDVMKADFDVFINRIGDAMGSFYQAIAAGAGAAFTGGDAGKAFMDALNQPASAATMTAENRQKEAMKRFEEAIAARGPADPDKDKEDEAEAIADAVEKGLFPLGKRLSFRDLGREIQDALLKTDDTHESRMERFEEMGLRKMDEMIMVLKEKKKEDPTARLA